MGALNLFGKALRQRSLDDKNRDFLIEEISRKFSSDVTHILNYYLVPLSLSLFLLFESLLSFSDIVAVLLLPFS
jgi:hypothetical protein